MVTKKKHLLIEDLLKTMFPQCQMGSTKDICHFFVVIAVIAKLLLAHTQPECGASNIKVPVVDTRHLPVVQHFVVLKTFLP